MPEVFHRMRASVLQTLVQKTGRDIDAWIALIRRKGPRDRMGAVLWLENDHGMGHVTAQIVASEAFGPPRPRLVEESSRPGPYAGTPAKLRPILDLVHDCVRGLGTDVETYETKGYVAWRRKRQFAIARSGGNRVELGLVMPGRLETDRLQKARGIGLKRISHVVSLEDSGDVDSEVRGWLREAYDRDCSH